MPRKTLPVLGKRNKVGDKTVPLPGTGTSPTPEIHQVRPYPFLTEGEIDARMQRAAERLRELDEVSFQDIPMADLTDEELQVRIDRAEHELLAGVGLAADDGLDELALLDYLIENPNASVAPLWALNRSPELWHDWMAFNDPDDV